MKLKQWQNIFHVVINPNSIVQHVVQIKNGIIKHANVNVKIIVSAKKYYSWNPSTCICESSKYLKIISDNSKFLCEEIISVMDIVSTKMTGTIATNLSINSDDLKVRYKTDCYILDTVLLVIILPLITTIIYYHCVKYSSKE